MKAMILAAGRGERMRPLTDKMPKPLIMVADKPMIVHHIQNLARSGFTDIVINVSYLAEQIQNYLGDGSKFQVKIQYSYEPTALETGGGIKNALPLLGKDPFLIINSDVWTDYPLHQLPKTLSDLAHLILVKNPGFKTTGDFGFEDGFLALTEKPAYTYSGIGVLHPALFNKLSLQSFRLADLLIPAIKEKKISGELYQGVWIDVGTPDRLNHLIKSLN